MTLASRSPLASRGRSDIVPDLESALTALSQPLLVIDANLCLRYATEAYRELFGFPPDLMVPGTSMRNLVRHVAREGHYAADDLEAYIETRLAAARQRLRYRFTAARFDGSTLHITGEPLADGGYAYSFRVVPAARIGGGPSR